MSSEAPALTAFRETLLRGTVDWCRAHSAFYRERFASLPDVVGLNDLETVPVLTRDEVIANRVSISCSNNVPAHVQYTTGTSGSFLPLYRSDEEVKFIFEFYSRALGGSPNASPRPLYLALTSTYHGASTALPSSAVILQAGMYDRTQAAQTRNLLEYRFAFDGADDRVSAVLGADILIRALTAYLLDEGVNPASLGVRQLICTGGYMSTATKLQLAAIWKANVVDRLSMSEIFGGAVQAAPGTPWIFDVEAIPEVVHPRTLTPISRGVGALLMTSLYPFSQMTPLVRYRTGDLVEIVGEYNPGRNNLAVQLKGRERRAVLDCSGDMPAVLLASTDVADAIDDMPDVQRSVRFSGLASEASLEYIGKPHFSIEQVGLGGCPTKITVKFGLRYAPWQFRKRIRAMSDAIRDRLYAASSELHRRVRDGEVELDLEFLAADRVSPFNMK